MVVHLRHLMVYKILYVFHTCTAYNAFFRWRLVAFSSFLINTTHSTNWFWFGIYFYVNLIIDT